MSRNRQNQLAAHTSNAAHQALNTLLKRAENHYVENEIDEALAVLIEAEDYYPEHPQIPYLIGKYTAEKKSTVDGIKKLEEVLTRFPTHLPSLLELGTIYLKPGDTNRANQFLHKALEIAPNDPSCHLNMGSLNQRKGDLPLAVENYRKAIELQLKHSITNDEPKPKDDFKITEAENLLWETLKLMTKNGLHVFMAFGSLLGIERNSELLLHDKDVDVGLPHSEMERALRFLKNHGWQEVNNSFGYFSPRAMVHIDTGFSMDLFSFMVDKKTKNTICVGAGISGTPKEWNIIWEFDRIELEKRNIPNSKDQVWYLKEPKAWLDKIYGDWYIPDKNFDTMVSAKNLQHFSLLSKCFTYSRVFNNWTQNNIPRALSLTRTALHHEPNDILLKRVLTRLENRRKTH